MAAVLLITAIGSGGVAFMVRFFMALCNETKSRACHVVRLLPDSKWQTESEECTTSLPAAIPRIREFDQIAHRGRA
jgi:hypothetical protein